MATENETETEMENAMENATDAETRVGRLWWKVIVQKK